ncbi:DUF6970 domain-containing protein [Spirosoma koreense]
MRFIFIIAFIFLGLDYQPDELPTGTPDCLRAMVEQIRHQHTWSPPARVVQYVYQGKRVYFIPIRCCDIPSKLYDENCNLICFPNGGFAGRGDGQCTDFFAKRSDEKLIWEDTRK